MNKPRYPIKEYEDMYMPSCDTDSYLSGQHSHLVKGRKEWKCAYCGAKIDNGDFSLSEKGFIDGKPYLIHYCMDCVDDELDVWNRKKDREDAYNEWVKRYEKSDMAARHTCPSGDERQRVSVGMSEMRTGIDGEQRAADPLPEL